MDEATLIRRWVFRASHHYGRLDWSDEQNRRAFGDQVDAHAHDWTVQLEVVGTIQEGTGFVADLDSIDEAFMGVVGGWRGGDLNELIPDVREGAMQPSTESIARWIFLQIEGLIPPPARLRRVSVWESDEVGAAFPAECGA